MNAGISAGRILNQMKQIVDLEKQIQLAGKDLPRNLFEKAKKYGFSDIQLAHLTKRTDRQIEVPLLHLCASDSSTEFIIDL